MSSRRSSKSHSKTCSPSMDSPLNYSPVGDSTITLYEEAEHRLKGPTVRSEDLFDRLIGADKQMPKTYGNRCRKPLSSVTNNSVHNKTLESSLRLSDNLEPSPKTSRNRKKKVADIGPKQVKWAPSPEKRVAKKTQNRKQRKQKSMSEQVSEAWDLAREHGLPDFDEIGKHELHVSKWTERADPPTPPMHQVMAAFDDLLPRDSTVTEIASLPQIDANDDLLETSRPAVHRIASTPIQRRPKASVPRKDLAIGREIVDPIEPCMSSANSSEESSTIVNRTSRTFRRNDRKLIDYTAEELSTIFDPLVKSTPLFPPEKYNLVVDMSSLDQTMTQMYRSSSASAVGRLRPTTTCVPVLDSFRAKSKTSSVKRFYRQSLASVQSELNRTCQPLRTVLHTSDKTIDADRSVFHSPQELKNCSKNVSLSASMFGKSKLVAKDSRSRDSFSLTAKQKVLYLCGQTEVKNFGDVIHCYLNSCRKIGEGSYGEVFAAKHKDKEIVIKIIPLIQNDNQSEDQMFGQILPELAVSFNFNRLKTGVGNNMSPNFIHMMDAVTVCGRFPDKLVDEWDKFDEQMNSENEDPRTYGDEQLYMLFFLDNGGQDLENYSFDSAKECLSVFCQISLALAAAEDAFQFEHRDLHWGNVLVAPTGEQSLRYSIRGTDHQLRPNGVIASIIDFSLSRMTDKEFVIFDDLAKYKDLFEGVGDYQFDIYRKMRELNGDDWQRFVPKTNLLWLHYTIDKMIAAKKYTKYRTNVHKKAVALLKEVSDWVLEFESTVELIESKQFSQLLSHL